jgi:hypothetical protein
MALQRLHRSGDDPAQMVGGTSRSAVRLGQVGKEPLGAALHDGEQHSVLRPEVVVDGAQRHAGFLDDAGDRRCFEAVCGHDSLGRIEDQRTRLHSAPVGRHGCLAGHVPIVANWSLHSIPMYCSVHSKRTERGDRDAVHRG